MEFSTERGTDDLIQLPMVNQSGWQRLIAVPIGCMQASAQQNQPIGKFWAMAGDGQTEHRSLTEPAEQNRATGPRSADLLDPLGKQDHRFPCLLLIDPRHSLWAPFEFEPGKPSKGQRMGTPGTNHLKIAIEMRRKPC